MKFDYDYILERYGQFWNRANEDRPLVYLFGPGNKRTIEKAAHHATLKDAWMDTEYQLKITREAIENTFYLGEAYPMMNPNLGPDFIGAVCGCDLEFGNRTSWAEPCITDYEEFPPITFDKNNIWWKKILEITEAALEDSKGDYIVGITDLHPGADGLVSLRGPQDAAMDIYDEPEQFKRIVWELLPVFKEMATTLHGMISAKQKGCSNWMGVVHPTELWYPPSCDFSCMISPETFDEFILPELKAEIDWLPNAIYHLDGPGALRHLDKLLAIENLKGIQWVYGAGQPSGQHWGEVLQKIQAAGKCIEMYCEPEDLVPLCKIVDPRGVQFKCTVPDQRSGEYLLQEMERVCKENRGQFSFYH